jgi:hypothetical protein
LNLEPNVAQALPETYALIRSANLTVHPAVSRITLHGSRGLAGGYHSNSDLDLSLIVEGTRFPILEKELQEVLKTTLSCWQSDIELDLAVIFDVKGCGLGCFEQTKWNEHFCQFGGIDCFGLFKTQKAFTGLVTNAGIQVRLMYPCLKIWQRR